MRALEHNGLVEGCAPECDCGKWHITQAGREFAEAPSKELQPIVEQTRRHRPAASAQLRLLEAHLADVVFLENQLAEARRHIDQLVNRPALDTLPSALLVKQVEFAVLARDAAVADREKMTVSLDRCTDALAVANARWEAAERTCDELRARLKISKPES